MWMADDQLANWLTELRPQLVAYAMAHCRNPDEAQDIAADAMVRLHTNRARIDWGRNHKGYALKIVKNLCFDSRKRARRRQSSPIDDAFQIPDSRAAQPVDTLIILEQHQEALRALRRLDPLLEGVVFDLYLHRLSYAQCAAKRGVTVGTVKSAVWRARTAIIKAMKRPEYAKRLATFCNLSATFTVAFENA